MFKFIVYMFSEDKIISKVNFFDFTFYVVLKIDFNSIQNYKLKKEILCESCDNFYCMKRLLNQLFSKQDLMI